MRQMLLIEFRRAFVNKNTLTVLIIGLVICVHQWLFVQQLINVQMFDMAIEYKKAYMQLPDMLWGWWLGGCPVVFHGFLYFLIMPILAALPHANSYLRDLKDGHVKNVLIKVRRADYYFAKWLAVFVSGGVMVLLPLAINLVLSLTVYPILGPYPESDGSLADSNFMSNLYYSFPFSYIALYFLVIFLFAGIYATSCLVVTQISDYSFVVLLLPFLLIVFFTTLLDLFDLSYISPQTFLFPGNGEGDLLIILLELLILISSSFCVFIYNGLKGNDF